MSLNKLFILFYFSLTLAGCSTKESQKLFLQSDLTPQEINIEENIEGVGFLESLSTVNYIQLETDSNFFIARCSKIISHNSRFIILDKSLSSVNVFNSKGKHLFNVGKIGGGPGEFLRLDDMEVDTLKNQILLWSNDNMSLFKYDINDGSFIEQIRMPFFGSYFGLVDNQYIIYTDYNVQKESESKNLLISDQAGNVSHSYFPFPSSRPTMAFSFSGFLVKNDVGYLYAHALSDTVYEISSDLKLYPKYHFNLGPNSWTKHFNIFDHETFSVKGLEYSHLFTPVFERGGYIFFTFAQNQKIKKGFFNRKKNTVYTTDSFKDDLNFDLFNIPVGVHSTSFISVIYPDKIYSVKDKYSKFDEVIAKNSLLKEVILNVKEEDNPILMFFNFKD